MGAIVCEYGRPDPCDDTPAFKNHCKLYDFLPEYLTDNGQLVKTVGVDPDFLVSPGENLVRIAKTIRTEKLAQRNEEQLKKNEQLALDNKKQGEKNYELLQLLLNPGQGGKIKRRLLRGNLRL